MARKATLPANVVRLADYRKPAPVKATRKKGASFYEIYPMPFFDRKARSSWSVVPTGDYSADVKTGREYGRLFVQSCDMTVGWQTLLASIVGDMVRAGPMTACWSDGRPKNNGIITGFMGVVATYAMWALGQIKINHTVEDEA